jgi:hypothetical protein
MPIASRLQLLLAASWAGILIAVGAMAAPSLFAVLDRALAGLAAGRIFAVEAHVSVALAMVLFIIERQRTRHMAVAQPGASVMSAEVLLTLGALFATVLGHFALRPMMEAAKAGQGSVSFGALHAISSSLFLFKGLLVLALAWRLTGRR